MLTAIRNSGVEIIPYDERWAAGSGIRGESSLRQEHKHLCHALALFVTFDQVDMTNLAGIELMSRRLLQIERAVKASPRAPSFLGLEKMTQHAIDEGGGLATQEFTQHFATVAESDARIMRQQRLLRDELRARESGATVPPAADADDPDGAAPPPGGRGRRPRGKKA